MPPESCTKVLRAIPKDLLGKMHGFALDGNWGSQTTFTIDSRDFDATVLDIRVANGCRFVSAPAAASVRRFRNRFWHRVVEPDETVFKMLTGPKSDNWTPLAAISPFIVQSVVSHEDGGFYRHGGFAPWAIRDALVRNLKEGRFVLGASTISMQLTKNIFLNREKTLGRKAQEVVLTWWLENEFTKDEIIELYLNVIEYGPGVYGITNASKYYFGRLPEELSPAEAAFLACVLPSPKTLPHQL